jgi:CPA1 family monovalent cation:H+ antiporter
LPPVDDRERTADERARLATTLRIAGLWVLAKNGRDTSTPFPELVSGPMPPGAGQMQESRQDDKRVQLEMIEAQRSVLLAAMSDGSYSSESINAAMANLDADQVSLELKGAPAGGH